MKRFLHERCNAPIRKENLLRQFCGKVDAASSKNQEGEDKMETVQTRSVGWKGVPLRWSLVLHNVVPDE